MQLRPRVNGKMVDHKDEDGNFVMKIDDYGNVVMSPGGTTQVRDKIKWSTQKTIKTKVPGP
jgi:hypothetical protein